MGLPLFMHATVPQVGMSDMTHEAGDNLSLSRPGGLWRRCRGHDRIHNVVSKAKYPAIGASHHYGDVTVHHSLSHQSPSVGPRAFLELGRLSSSML